MSRSFLASVLSLLLLISTAYAEPRQPNVVLIVADDLG
jgi:hypothetical protein